MTRTGESMPIFEINILEDDLTVKSRLVKLALTVGSALTALLAGAAQFKIT